MMEPLYTATVTANGGREGHVKSEDGIIDLDVRQPKELGGSGEQAVERPEWLLRPHFYQSANTDMTAFDVFWSKRCRPYGLSFR